MKASFVKRVKGGYKYGRKQNDILVYSYRGYEYDIEDIPPYQRPEWYFQDAHSAEQARIDSIIESSKHTTQMNSTVDNALEYFFKMLGE